MLSVFGTLFIGFGVWFIYASFVWFDCLKTPLEIGPGTEHFACTDLPELGYGLAYAGIAMLILGIILAAFALKRYFKNSSSIE